MFKDKFIDIQTSEVESKLKAFWLKLGDDGDSLAEDFMNIQVWIEYISVHKRVWRKNLKDKDWPHPNKLYIYKQPVNLKIPIKSIAFDYHLSETIIREIEKKTEKLHIDRTSMNSTTKRTLTTSMLVKNKIASFIDSNSKPITPKEVWLFVLKEIGSEYQFT